MVAFAIADLGGELPVARDVEPSDGRACCFSIERAPQINLRRWPPCLAHPLRCARRLEDPLWGELLNGNPRLASGIGAQEAGWVRICTVDSLCSHYRYCLRMPLLTMHSPVLGAAVNPEALTQDRAMLPRPVTTSD